MSGPSRRRFLVTASGVALTGLAGCLAGGDTAEPPTDTETETTEASSPALSVEDVRRTGEHGGVQVAVDFVNPLVDAGAEHPLGADTDDALLFYVIMNTHSGDLTSVDWGERASLRTDQGHDVDGLEWVWERESRHHPEGYYRVAKRPADDKSLVDGTSVVELRIRDVDGGTLSFAWDRQHPRDADVSLGTGLRSYISNATSGSISVVDHDDRAVVETLSVAERTSHGIAMHPDGTAVYVGGANTDLYAISTDSGEVLDTLEVNSTAHGVDIHPDGHHLYVSGGSLDVDGDVAVVDVADYEIVQGIETDGAGHINFGPDGTYAYVSNVSDDLISVIDTNALEMVASVDVGAGPNEAVAAPDGTHVYTANVRDSSVSIVEVDEWEELERIPVGEGTHGIDITPDGQYLWTANRGSNDVAVVETETREVLEAISLDVSANHLSVTPDGATAYVTAGRSDEVVLIDSSTYDVMTRIEVGTEPHEIAFPVPR